MCIIIGGKYTSEYRRQKHTYTVKGRLSNCYNTFINIPMKFWQCFFTESNTDHNNVIMIEEICISFITACNSELISFMHIFKVFYFCISLLLGVPIYLSTQRSTNRYDFDFLIIKLSKQCMINVKLNKTSVFFYKYFIDSFIALSFINQHVSVMTTDYQKVATEP